MRTLFIIIGSALSLAACSSSEQRVELPEPIMLTAEAVGHFCQMTVLDHPGPKAQVHLEGQEMPLWFAQVRDALAYDRMPEESGEIAAIYVNDMATAASWEEPGVSNWIEISTAHFVIDSASRGGMGAPELVPFSTQAAATAFAGEHGGSVIGFAGILDDMVLAPIEVEAAPESEPEPHGGDGHAHGDDAAEAQG